MRLVDKLAVAVVGCLWDRSSAARWEMRGLVRAADRVPPMVPTAIIKAHPAGRWLVHGPWGSEFWATAWDRARDGEP